MIALKQIGGSVIDLSASKKFVKHYNNPNSFAKHIIETEINAGLWYDEILETLPDDSVIIDAGANVGLWSLYMLPKAKQIYAIEPTYSHVLVLIDLQKAFNLPLHIDNSVLANYDGECEFGESLENSTTNKIGMGEILPCVSLKTFLESIKSVDLLKLDIEGAEQQVILENETVGEALLKCKMVYVECHLPPYGNTNEQGIIDKMISLGFKHKPAKQLAHYFYQ